MTIVKVGVYYTVKINFPGQNAGSLGVDLRTWKAARRGTTYLYSPATPGKTTTQRYSNKGEEKRQKKYPRKLILGYIGKLEVSTIYQVLLNPT